MGIRLQTKARGRVRGRVGVGVRVDNNREVLRQTDQNIDAAPTTATESVVTGLDSDRCGQSGCGWTAQM